MAKRKPSNDNGVTVGYQAELWRMADALPAHANRYGKNRNTRGDIGIFACGVKRVRESAG